jgi:hypothetical protein
MNYIPDHSLSMLERTWVLLFEDILNSDKSLVLYSSRVLLVLALLVLVLGVVSGTRAVAAHRAIAAVASTSTKTAHPQDLLRGEAARPQTTYHSQADTDIDDDMAEHEEAKAKHGHVQEDEGPTQSIFSWVANAATYREILATLNGDGPKRHNGKGD